MVRRAGDPGIHAPKPRVVSVETEPTFTPGNPEALFNGPYRVGSALRPRPWDVAQDGRFLMIKEHAFAEKTDPHIVVVEHWFSELERLLPSQLN